MRGWNRLSILIQDVGRALRTLRRSPGFAITAFLTLGIGASTAVFTVVDSVILKPLACRDSGDLANRGLTEVRRCKSFPDRLGISGTR
jgi:hypothetical protein